LVTKFRLNATSRFLAVFTKAWCVYAITSYLRFFFFLHFLARVSKYSKWYFPLWFFDQNSVPIFLLPHSTTSSSLISPDQYPYIWW
jgi:hypothetical protein